ncbi:uncharacterized protein BXIN_2119 [Babesia sp. Xinjiang]|uniref:uncharacterized protein n=1 Tax=Babesia sp. Xinjiang TaxID=462227 RepID=UPI000A265DBF|nr:uncharacterized protein BXIN_2119 [Babesia sp. Xinjiang]ORM40595.1 hypothetical protein BXIN_2119 [Babesia sp. Xinjiang]
MNFVRTQNYSGDKGSGGLIDFTKSSLLSTDREAPAPKERRRPQGDKNEIQFKPKELFSDRDLEYIAENLTSATAIASAFSEEDIAHLDNLERKRNQLWKKRKLEEEEFAREAERVRKSLSEKEDLELLTNSDETDQSTVSEVKTSLFTVTRKDTVRPKVNLMGEKVTNEHEIETSKTSAESESALVAGYSSDED